MLSAKNRVLPGTAPAKHIDRKHRQPIPDVNEKCKLKAHGKKRSRYLRDPERSR